MEEKMEYPEKIRTRRELLKKATKASIFIIPTLMTFKKSDLAVAASVVKLPGTPSPYGK